MKFILNHFWLNRIPDEVYVKSLERSHAQLVYDNHFFSHQSSIEDVADEIDELPSAGVFLKENNQLVSWIVYCPPFGMSRFFTLEGYRRRGYGKLVVQYMAKRAVQSGYQIIAHTAPDSASIPLFESLDFTMQIYELIY